MEGAIIAGAVGLISSIIGAVIILVTANRSHRLQLELQTIQIRAQMELKARELMFEFFQKKNEQFSKEMKELGEAMAQLSMAKHIPIVDEHQYYRTLLAFTATIKIATDPIVDKMDDFENELREAGLHDKSKNQIDFIKEQLRSTLTAITPTKIESNFENISKALAYLVEIRNSMVEKKKEELFSEYLPSKNVTKK